MKKSRKLIGFVKRKELKKLNFDANNQVSRFDCKISVMKDLINSEPYYICLVCL